MDEKVKVMKRLGWNILIFVVLIGLTFWFVFKDQDMGQLVTMLEGANLWWVLVGVVTMILHFLVEARNIQKILRALGEEITLWQAFKFTLIGFFFCAVTPGASGGQVMEIYYMTKEKVTGANATVTLLVQVCAMQVGIISLGIVGAILCPEAVTGAIAWLFWIGLGLNTVALAVVMVCLFSQKLARKLVNIFVRIVRAVGYKKIDEKKKRLEEGLAQYAEGAKFIKANKKEFGWAMARGVLQVALLYAVTYCVYLAFGLSGESMWQIMALQAVLYAGTSAMPLPGAVGISETAFLTLFGVAFGEGMVGSAMLLARGIGFYWFVILGLVVVFVNAVKMRGVTGEIDQELKK